MANDDFYNDDIIWEEPEDKKKKKQASPTPSPSPAPAVTPKSEPQPEQQNVYSQVHYNSRQEDLYYSKNRHRYYNTNSFWQSFYNSFGAYGRYRRRRYRRNPVVALIIFLVFVFGFAVPNYMSTHERFNFREFWTLTFDNNGIETTEEPRENARENTLSGSDLATQRNRVLYAKNFTALEQANLILQAEGKSFSYTASGLADYFAQELNVSGRTEDTLYLADGASFAFDCDEEDCSVEVDLNINGSKVMQVPLYLNESGKLYMNRKDVSMYVGE